MSWIKPAKLQPPTQDKMEEMIKQLVQANLKQQQAMDVQQQAIAQQQKRHEEALLVQQQAIAQQQETNRQLLEANQRQQDTNQRLLQHVMVLEKSGMPQGVHDARKAVRTAVPKMTPTDDVETYLAMFEKVAVRERLPRDQWAEVIAPFLASGPQQVYFDLPDDQAADYSVVKGEILARLGVNVLVRAQRVHQWEFNPAEPARPQYYNLLKLLQKWLPPDVLSPTAMLDRIVADKFWRALPLPLQRWVGQTSPTSALEMVDLVERYGATEELKGGTLGKGVIKPRKSPPQTLRPELRKTAQDVPFGDRDSIICWRCQEPGHVRANCPLLGEPMDVNFGYRQSLYARRVDVSEVNHDEHLCRVEVGDTPVAALLDSGSQVTLVRASLVRPTEFTGRRVGVFSIHGDLKEYPTALLSVNTCAGRQVHEVAVTTSMPYDVIIGRDFPLFPALWPAIVHTVPRQVGKLPVVRPNPGEVLEPQKPKAEGPTVGPVGEGKTVPLSRIGRKHRKVAQPGQSRSCNRVSGVRSQRDPVLVVGPPVDSKDSARGKGTYKIAQKVGDPNYKVHQPGLQKPEPVYHVNLRKPWKVRETCIENNPRPVYLGKEIPVPLSANREAAATDKITGSLSTEQTQRAKEFVSRNTEVFCDFPECPSITHRDIVTEPQAKVWLKPYQVPVARRQAISERVIWGWPQPVPIWTKKESPGSPEGSGDFRTLDFQWNTEQGSYREMRVPGSGYTVWRVFTPSGLNKGGGM